MGGLFQAIAPVLQPMDHLLLFFYSFCETVNNQWLIGKKSWFVATCRSWIMFSIIDCMTASCPTPLGMVGSPAVPGWVTPGVPGWGMIFSVVDSEGSDVICEALGIPISAAEVGRSTSWVGGWDGTREDEPERGSVFISIFWLKVGSDAVLRSGIWFRRGSRLWPVFHWAPPLARPWPGVVFYWH